MRRAPAIRRAAVACLALVAAACASPPAVDEPDGDGGPLVVDAGGSAMPEVITDGPERVARLRDEIEILIGLTRLKDPELDEIEAIETELDLFMTGRARVTLQDLEARYTALQSRVLARMR